ncbi:putative haloalkane dehalogenase [Arabidopsis thaliana]
MAAWKSWIVAEKARRCLRTMFFVAAMTASLLASSLPVLITVADVVVPCLIVSSITCLTCHSPAQHFRQYSFKTSLIDVPLVSLLRSLVIICLSWVCEDTRLAYGPFLETVMISSFGGILLLLVKTCVFTVNSHLEEAKVYHLKISWGMPVLLLSSAVFGLAHVVVAYRKSCGARRKLMFSHVNRVFSGYKKAHRQSFTRSNCKILTFAGEFRQKSFRGTSLDREELLQPRLLANADSLFIKIQGLYVHYKQCTSPSVSSFVIISDSAAEMNARRSRLLDKQMSNLISQTQSSHLHRSYTIQPDRSSLYDPLLASYQTTPISLFDKNDVNKINSMIPEDDLEKDGNTGIVLVHGFGGGVFSWRHVMGELSLQLGCRVVAYDRPGWGLTSRLIRKDWEKRNLANPYKLESQVDLLLSFCSEMGFSSVILVGHDDGGLLALKAAERMQASTSKHNITIKGVVLINVSLSREVVPAFARILLHTSLRKKHLVRPLLRTEITQLVNRRAWCDTTKLTTDITMLYKAPLCLEAWDEALNEISKLSYEMILSPQNASALVKSIGDLPVLVVAGAEDALVPLKSSQVLASKLTNSRLVEISGCGHLPHEECPTTLVSALGSFICRLIPKLPNS